MEMWRYKAMSPRHHRWGRQKLRKIFNKCQEEELKGRVNKTGNKFDCKTNKNNNDHKIWRNLHESTCGIGEFSSTTLKTAQLFNCENNSIKKCQEKHNNIEEGLDYENLPSFHRVVRPVLILGQCFALMPVVGVQNPNPQYLRFSVKSWAVMVTGFILTAISSMTLASIKYLAEVGVNARNFVLLVFYGCVQTACILFFLLASKWPNLIRYWFKIELIFIKGPYESPKRNLSQRIHFAAGVVIILFSLEHALSLASAVYGYAARTRICAQLLNTTESFSFKDFLHQKYDYAFKLLPSNTAAGILLVATNAISTFIWNFMDLFIMVISIGVAYRFEQIKMRINKLVNKEVPESTFIEIREHYVKVCNLLENIDNSLSNIILLSCINNLYFICFQLMNIFNPLRWPIDYIYCWYSLLYLIGRTASVFLIAASINEKSNGSLSGLRRVSNKSWCVEVERLIFDMSTQTVAFSGKKFYFLTRRLLFGMAGTIVTYELVLLQFDEPNRSKGLSELCA